MWKKLLLLAALGTIAAVLPGSHASAQATRTWVSGVGDDANPCSRTAPCKTWAGAISKTAAGGEIDALDPGGFGALTITKSITLDGGGGQVASVLVAGTNGIVVAAGSTDVVILRNLRFQGLLGNGSSPSNAGINGISFSSGAKLVVERCDIIGFNNDGILASVSAAATLSVLNTTIANIGKSAMGLNTTATLTANVEGVSIWNNAFGIAVGTGVKIHVDHSLMAGGTAAGAEADPGATLFIDNSEITSNATGVLALGTIVLGNSDITFNTTGISGATSSYGNNRIFGNGAPGTTPTVIGQN
jgi:hypothetical protein